MELFSDEKICVTALHYVLLHKSDGLPHDYGLYMNGCRMEHCELIFKISGSCRVQFGGHDFFEQAGDIRFLPKGEFDDVYHVEGSPDSECIYFSFDYEGTLPEGAIVITPRASEQYRALFEKLYSVWTLRGSGYYQRALSIVYRIIGCIQAERDESYLSGRQRETIERSLVYLENHVFDARFDYEALAEAGGVSYSYYKRLFGKRFGVPPSRYIQSLRIKRARELLEAGMTSVSQTAEAVGFEDTAYFCRVFKKETGASPTAWRRGRKKTEQSE